MSTFWKRLFRTRRPASCPQCHATLADKVTYCDSCGYDLVRQTRDRTLGPRRIV